MIDEMIFITTYCTPSTYHLDLFHCFVENNNSYNERYVCVHVYTFKRNIPYAGYILPIYVPRGKTIGALLYNLRVPWSETFTTNTSLPLVASSAYRGMCVHFMLCTRKKPSSRFRAFPPENVYIISTCPREGQIFTMQPKHHFHFLQVHYPMTFFLTCVYLYTFSFSKYKN